MTTISSFSLISTDNDESFTSDMANLSISKSSPLIKSQSLSIDYQPHSIINNLKSLPLNVLLTTSNNTKLSLNLTEITETPRSNSDNNNNAEKSPTTPGKNVTFRFNSNDNDIKNEYENKKKDDKNYKLGDLVILNKNKQGLIRYIGEIYGDAHIWYGVELIGGYKGFHNGTFQGQKYFACGIHQGIFVKKHQIVRKMTPIDFNISPNTPKTPKTPKKSKTPKTPKKLGPRDIGKIKGWKPSRDIYQTDLEKQHSEMRKKYKAQRRNKNKRSSLTDIESELSQGGSLFKSTTIKQVSKKPGPRDIGRIHSKETDWKPIEDADKIIEQENKKGFLDPSIFKSNTQRRIRASSSALLVKKSGPRSISNKKKDKRKKVTSFFRKKKNKNKEKDTNKLTINKNSMLLKLDSIKTRQRSKTPTPSTSGLQYSDSDVKITKKVKRMRKKKYEEPSSLINYGEEREKTRNKSRVKKRNKQRKSDVTKNKKKIKSAKKYDFESGRSRSQTVHVNYSRINDHSDVEFPDIMKFDEIGNGTGNKHHLGLFKKKKKKKTNKYHKQSYSTGHNDNSKHISESKPVIIRVYDNDKESDDNIENDKIKIGHNNKGLNMSKTDGDDDMLFAEVKAEIEQRQSGLKEIEKQLNELQNNNDFDLEFEKSLKQGKIKQNNFKESHQQIIKEIESDIDENIQNNKGKINSMKIKRMLWDDDSDDENNNNDHNNNDLNTQYVE